MSALLFREDAYLKACEATVVAVNGNAVELDRTIFYPLGGGQAGDTGRIDEFKVVDTRKGDGDAVLHLMESESPLKPGGKVCLSLDWDRRYRLMRMHTALHLLGSIVRAPVTGGRIAEDKAHLDFDIELERLQKEALEERLNALTASPVKTRALWITDQELDARPELVRTMSVAPPRGAGRVRLLEIPGVDLQACGGTHVADVTEIGRLKIVKLRSEGKRNKRVTLELG